MLKSLWTHSKDHVAHQDQHWPKILLEDVEGSGRGWLQLLHGCMAKLYKLIWIPKVRLD